MATIHTKILCWHYREKKDGSFPVVLRVTINRRVKYLPLNFSVKPKDFNDNKLRVRATDPKQTLKNGYIVKALNKVANIEEHFMRYGNPNLNEFIQLYQADEYNPDSFYDYVDLKVRTKKNKEGNGPLRDETIKFYAKQKSKLQAYRPTLSFGDIDKSFLEGYKQYLIIEKGNKPITWNKSLEFIRRLLNDAFKEGRISKNPFRDFTISTPKGSLDHLTFEEVRKLMELYEAGSLSRGKQNVLRYFLFCCYTGLRYSDIKALTFNCIKTDKGDQWIEFDQQKTGKKNKIPLIPQAVELLPEQSFKEQKVFRVIGNQPTNRYLGDILKENGIAKGKRITFHSSRHTCSNLLYRLEVPIEIRSKIVGDTEQVVSHNYTDPDMALLQKAMTKYSQKLNE